MPSLTEHCKADERELGKAFPHVHKLLDQFAHYPDMDFLRVHRQFLHHKEGIDYIRKRFGEKAGQAADLHVRMDCGHVPTMEDYALGSVDTFGRKGTRW